MLKRLQRKFVAIAILALVTIVFVELFSVNVVNVYQRDSDSKSILYLIAQNDGVLPNTTVTDAFTSGWNPFSRTQITVETPYSTRYFVVKLHDNTVTDISTRNIASVSDRTAFEYAAKVYGEEPGYGFLDIYRYYYARDDATGNSIMVFLDFERELEATFALATVSFLVGVIFILLLSFPVYLLTRSALAPVRRSIEQQKQFITDASHELKTPLAIISADADVLELCGGENEWVSSIKSQTARMDTLVRNLVSLSKLDETANESEHVTFNVSEAVLDTALNFEPLAKSRDLRFSLDVTPDLTLKGSEGEIRQLVSLLCDNALKYTNDGGEIRLSLYKSGKSLCLDAYNTCESIEKDKLPHLFDRFYRADNSRARETGGYGIGLSIAKAIVERHKGKIGASSADGRSILFRIQL
ncbi:MAG: GHKL domain-containing protein [Clostridia bacterium]|nr:GHKL domain-containing protein [Clostridia bacterium]